ncbi:MAG: hypothetical protein E6K98_01605 [Thaumarchaeota archaeon]|nr:MAG: hypothetical protein E6K98_01605 [Nitrososphaerota archaeon]
MGISVPISAEYYDKLKIISDRLDTGLKKTVEYLVSYYWQREIKQGFVESRKVKPRVIESREVKPIRQLLEELGREYDILPSNVIKSSSRSKPQSAIYTDSDIGMEFDSKQAKAAAIRLGPGRALGTALTTSHKGHDVISSPQKFSIPSPQDIAANCSRCGSPKRPSARYCHNCGSLLS